MFGAALNLIYLIGSVIIPESPEYLYSFYKFTQTKKVMQRIAKINGVKLDPRYLFNTEYEMKALRLMIQVEDED